jgi:hypothetical protein
MADGGPRKGAELLAQLRAKRAAPSLQVAGPDTAAAIQPVPRGKLGLGASLSSSRGGSGGTSSGQPALGAAARQKQALARALKPRRGRGRSAQEGDEEPGESAGSRGRWAEARRKDDWRMGL